MINIITEHAGYILPAIQLYTYKIIPQEYYTAVVSGMTVDSAHLLVFLPLLTLQERRTKISLQEK